MSRCTVTMITRLDHPRRGVALLEYPLPYVNAKAVFDRMVEDRSDRHHQKSFDYWLGGQVKRQNASTGLTKDLVERKRANKANILSVSRLRILVKRKGFMVFSFIQNLMMNGINYAY
jgi:hypothetical protein